MKVIASHDFGPHGFKWLTLKRITWTGPDGRPRFWEAVERTTRASCGVDGVAIIARLLSASAPPRILIERQYRPPLSAFCLELPAGLIDEGEAAGEAALRELREETGYTGTLVAVTPVSCCDPGITNANMQVAIVDVDADAPENVGVCQNLHDGEFIAVDEAPWEGLYTWLMAEKAARGCEIDARLLSFALGLEQAGEMSGDMSGVPHLHPAGVASRHASLALGEGLAFGSPLLQSEADLESGVSVSRSSTAQSVAGGSPLKPGANNTRENDSYNNTEMGGQAEAVPATTAPVSGNGRAPWLDGVGAYTSSNAGGTITTSVGAMVQQVKEVVVDGRYLAGVATAAVVAGVVLSVSRR